ncbi:hypothetical protein CHUAL_011460 [Chamberlinius hualienensis]
MLFIISLISLLTFGEATFCFSDDAAEQVDSQLLISTPAWFVSWTNDVNSGQCGQYHFSPSNTSPNHLIVNYTYTNSDGEMGSYRFLLAHTNGGYYNMWLTTDPYFNPKHTIDVPAYGQATFIHFEQNKDTNSIQFSLVSCIDLVTNVYICSNNQPNATATGLQFNNSLVSDIHRITEIKTYKLNNTYDQNICNFS